MKYQSLLFGCSLLLLVVATSVVATNVQCPSFASDTQIILLLQNNSLIWFPPNTTNFRAIRVQGVNGQLIGIDVRPRGRTLWGVSNTQGLYQINLQTGIATSVSSLSQPLPGDNIGMDFNPAADRLRLISGVTNLRVNVDNGAAISDTNLRYAQSDINRARTPNIIGIAYNNNTDGVNATVLYGLDLVNANVSILVTINPPNDGILNTVGVLNIRGGGAVGGFDIYTGPQGCNTAVFATNGRFWLVDLNNGSPTLTWRDASGWLLEYMCNVNIFGLAIL